MLVSICVQPHACCHMIMNASCAACATGCRACTGPNNTDCLACADETLYIVTTDQFSSSVCVTAAECDDTAVSAFGDRTCIFNQSVSFNYNQLVSYEYII